jgi:hypothetical protein
MGSRVVFLLLGNGFIVGTVVAQVSACVQHHGQAAALAGRHPQKLRFEMKIYRGDDSHRRKKSDSRWQRAKRVQYLNQDSVWLRETTSEIRQEEKTVQKMSNNCGSIDSTWLPAIQPRIPDRLRFLAAWVTAACGGRSTHNASANSRITPNVNLRVPVHTPIRPTPRGCWHRVFALCPSFSHPKCQVHDVHGSIWHFDGRVDDWAAMLPRPLRFGICRRSGWRECLRSVLS